MLDVFQEVQQEKKFQIYQQELHVMMHEHNKLETILSYRVQKEVSQRGRWRKEREDLRLGGEQKRQK